MSVDGSLAQANRKKNRMMVDKAMLFEGMRRTVIALNALFIFGGCVAMLAGVHAALENKELEYLNQTQTDNDYQQGNPGSDGHDHEIHLPGHEDMNGGTLIIFAVITIVTALIGLIGACKRRFKMLFIFAIIVLISLLLRIIILITFPNQHGEDAISKAITILLAMVEFILAFFSLALALYKKGSRSADSRAAHPIEEGMFATVADITQVDSSKSDFDRHLAATELNKAARSFESLSLIHEETKEAETEVTTADTDKIREENVV